jgi:hypothetical protein
MYIDIHIHIHNEGNVTEASAKIDSSIHTGGSEDSIKSPKNENNLNNIQLKNIIENITTSSLPLQKTASKTTVSKPVSIDDKEYDDIENQEKLNLSPLLPKPQLELISNNNSTGKPQLKPISNNNSTSKPQLKLIFNNNSTGKLPQKSRHIEVNPQRKIEENNKKSEVDFNVDFLKSRFSEVELEKVQHLEIMKDVNMPIKNNPTPLLIPKFDSIIDNSSPKFDIKLGNIPPVLNKPTSETKTTNEIKFDTILGDILKPPVKLDSQDVLNLSPIKPPKFVPPIPLSPPKFDANSGEHILVSAPRKHEDFVPPNIKTDVLTGIYTYVLLYI